MPEQDFYSISREEVKSFYDFISYLRVHSDIKKKYLKKIFDSLFYQSLKKDLQNILTDNKQDKLPPVPPWFVGV